MTVRIQSCRGTGAEADVHSLATGGTLDIAHWSQPFPLHVHTGQQTCDQNLATPAHTVLGNPATRSQSVVTHLQKEMKHSAILIVCDNG
jgi:hypothetical protein